MHVSVHNRTDEFDSYRAARVKSLFNAESGANFTLDADLPIDDGGWKIGLIVGPSGSGKTSMGRTLWGQEAFWNPTDWPGDRPIVDAIAPDGNFDEVTAALAAVGLGNVPSWLRPFHVLSNGEQFRANLARVDTDVNLEVARTSVEVAWSFPSRPDRPGVLEHGCTTLLVEAPLLMENAAAVFAPGNVVRVEGRLEPFVERLDPERAAVPVRRRPGGEAGPNVVASAIERLDAEWAAKREKMTPGELAKAERAYYARRRSLQQDRALRVRAGLVTLLSGTVISVGEARRLRTERMERRRQAAARRGEGAVTELPTDVTALSEPGEADVHEPVGVQATEEVREQPQPVRYRRRRQAEAPEVLMTDAIAAVRVEMEVEPPKDVMVEASSGPGEVGRDAAAENALVDG